MIRTLPKNASDEQILSLVSEWVGLLAAEDYSGALEIVRSGPQWTPDLLARVITNWGDSSVESRGPTRVTREADADGTPTRSVDRFANGLVRVWYDLPLDGEWSDLTATFEVQEEEEGLVLVLSDVHIM